MIKPFSNWRKKSRKNLGLMTDTRKVTTGRGCPSLFVVLRWYHSSNEENKLKKFVTSLLLLSAQALSQAQRAGRFIFVYIARNVILCAFSGTTHHPI